MHRFYANNEQWAEGLEGQVMENLAKLEQAMGRSLATQRILCWCRFVQVPGYPCPA